MNKKRSQTSVIQQLRKTEAELRASIASLNEQITTAHTERLRHEAALHDVESALRSLGEPHDPAVRMESRTEEELVVRAALPPDLAGKTNPQRILQVMRNDPAKHWTPTTLAEAAHLHSNEAASTELSRLRTKGLVHHDKTNRVWTLAAPGESPLT